MSRAKIYFIYFLNTVKYLYIKIKYGKKVKASLFQLWGRHFQLQINDKGTVSIGKRMHTRNNTLLICSGGNLVCGDNVFLNQNVSITCLSKITIGSGTTIANNTVIVDHDHNFRGNYDSEFIGAPVQIGENVWIGANCVILKGTKIGDNSVIAAGSIVRGTIPSHSIFYQERDSKISLIKRC